jgi:type 1 glutamine amidotransferase
MSQPLIANLVCGSPYRNHDFDFARLRLASALYDAGGIRTDCFQDYEDSKAILRGDLLVSYTSQSGYSGEASTALRHYLERGGRWFALHASNSVRDNAEMPNILGTRFITHPTQRLFAVDVTDRDDPLMAGIEPFEIEDELWIMEDVTGDNEVLLQTRWGGLAIGGKTFPEADRPLLYRRRVGEGGILYLTLGHANRPYDKPFPDSPEQPDRRHAWEHPVFNELIRRGIDWAAKRRPF